MSEELSTRPCGCGRTEHQDEHAPAEHAHDDHAGYAQACEEDSCPAGCPSCGHAHGEEEEAPLKLWLPIGAGALLYAASFLLQGTARIALCLAAYAVLGAPILLQAAREIARGAVFGESFLMGVATLGALAIREYSEAVAVMLFFRIGEALQDIAVGQSRRSIRAAVGLRPEFARVKRGGEYREIDPAAVEVGEELLVNPGERVPLDATVIAGESLVDFSALTGESVPVRLSAGKEALAGGINQTGPLTLSVVRPASESAVSRVLRAVEDAARGKPKLENFITRFARVYTPIVVGVAALLACLPPLLGLGAFSLWLHRALLFLVVSCPCALVVSVPLTFFAGLANASSRGVLFKGANRMEQLSGVKAAVFDKTGTLTHGEFRVQRVLPEGGFTEAEVLALAAGGEHFSPHPVAHAIRKAAGEYAPAEVSEELAGRGVSALVAGRRVLVGSARLLGEHGIALPEEVLPGAALVAVDGSYAGAVAVADELRADAARAVARLNADVGFTAILTGDAEAPAREMAERAGVKEVFFGLLPEEKLSRMRQIREKHGAVLFVGDGINDAPVLTGADVGMAIGGGGTDMAVEAADVVLLSPELTNIPEAVLSSRRTLSIAGANIAFAIGVKVLVMALGAIGLANMWMAVFADVGTTLLCVLNALRLLPRKKRVA